MNVAVVEGAVLTAPQIYKANDSGKSVVFFLIQVSGMKEENNATTYDESLPVCIPFDELGLDFNQLNRETYVWIEGPLQRGRFPSLCGNWGITLGINAYKVMPLNRERYLRNKEAAKKQFKPKGVNENE